jgi:flavin-dependent dehydrogenase
VNGVLRRIGCERGLLIGDAAGAVSPLTAGGLDGCLRLTDAAVEAVGIALATGDRGVLAEYSGGPYRARFAVRRAMRRALSRVQSPLAAELLVRVLALPGFRALARHVYFGRGSFPDPVQPPARADSRRAVSAA